MAPPAGTPTFVATHRLTAEEAAVGEVSLHPDLEAVELVDGESLKLAAGGTAVLDHERPGDTCVMVGPRNWLGAAVAGGDLLAFHWDGGALSVSVADPAEVGDGAAVVEAVRSGMAGARERAGIDVEAAGEAAPLPTVLEAALADQPALLAEPVRPFSELLAELGLVYHGGWVGPSTTDWEALDAAVLRRNDLIMAAVAHRLTRAGFEALQKLLDAVRAERSEDGAGRLQGEAAGLALAAEEGVAPALLRLTGEADAEPLRALADRAMAATRGRAKAAALWLGASCAEAAGDRAGQESMLANAIGANASYRPALWDMSWYASDRGQAGRAASLLASAGAPADDPWRQRLEQYAKPGPNQSPRNDPCKCGSGRKAKSCCLQANGWPLSSRVAWLYDKATAFLNRPANVAAVHEVVDAWAAAAGDDTLAHDLTDDPLPTDLALFEGGVLARFVEERGPLLPADEAELAASWVGAPLRLCEVAEVRPEEGLVLDDLVTGERLEVAERSGSRALIPHLLVLTRVLPDGGGGSQLFGGIRTVPFGRHEGLLEALGDQPGAGDIAAALGAAAVLPTLTNTDGEIQVLGRRVYELAADASADEASRALAGALEEDSDGSWALFGEDDEEGGRTLRGRVRLEGRRLAVEANSERRLQEVASALEAAVPGVTQLDSVALPLDAGLLRRLLLGMGDEPGPAGTGPDDATHELVAQKLRQYEEAWIDEPIPALGGATPKEAAEDAERRRDLERLLADMELRSGGMDAGRIRSLLGLTA